MLRRFAVQPRTVFSGAPCLKLPVNGYTASLPTTKPAGSPASTAATRAPTGFTKPPPPSSLACRSPPSSWAPYLRHSPATQYSDAHGYYTYLLTISWLAILGGTYLLRNGKSAWRVLLYANLIAALHYALTA